MRKNATIIFILMAITVAIMFFAFRRLTTHGAWKTDQPIILLLLKDYNNEFFRKIEEGFRSGLPAAIKDNYRLDVRYGASETDLSMQRRQLDHYISEYASGRAQPQLRAVVVGPVASNDEITSEIKQLKDQNVFVVLVDQRIDAPALKRANTDYDSFIGSENSQGGAMAADAIVSHLPDGGTILVLNGVTGVQAAIDRREGFLHRLGELEKEKSTDYKTVERTANFTRSEAQNVVDGLLTMGQEPDAIFAANDEMALGALQALRQAKTSKPTIIVGFDAIREAVAAVKDGRLTATVAQDPVGMGERAAVTVDKLLEHQVVEKDQVLPPKLIQQ